MSPKSAQSLGLVKYQVPSPQRVKQHQGGQQEFIFRVWRQYCVYTCIGIADIAAYRSKLLFTNTVEHKVMEMKAFAGSDVG